MSKLSDIGILTLSGLGLGLLVAHAYKSNGKEEETGYPDATTTAKKAKKAIKREDQDSFNAAARINRIKKRGVRRKKRPLKMEKAGDAFVRKPLPRKAFIRNSPGRGPGSIPHWGDWLQKEFNCTQITITNTSTEVRTITLWGANKSISVSPPNPADVEDHDVSSAVTVPAAIGVGVQPQGIAVNPVNGFAYVANQLSNNVSVITPDGGVVTLIQLEPSNLPGSNSPVAVAVNTRQDSPGYGTVYVAGLVADTISVIDLAYTVTDEIPAGTRPTALAFNPVNENLYVANFVSNDVTVIDTTTNTVSATLPAGGFPRCVGINPLNGDIFVGNIGDSTVSVFDQGDNLITTILGVGRPIAMIYHPINDQMYVVGFSAGIVTPIDTSLYTPLALIGVGAEPTNIVFNTNNNFLYVANSADETYTVIAPDNSIRATLSLGNVNLGFAINQEENILFGSDAANNLVNVIGYNDQSSFIVINGDYQETNENFQHLPALVKHVKLVFSTADRFEVLTLRDETATGKINDSPVSLSAYNSPQHLFNVYEVFSMDGTMIDGLHTWIFQIAGEQTISLLVHYTQLELYGLLAGKENVFNPKNYS